MRSPQGGDPERHGDPAQTPASARDLADEDPVLDAGPGGDEGARLAHPLLGSSLSNLVRLFVDNGPVPANRLPHVALAFSTALLRSPFGALERLAVRLREDTGELPPPVFVVGHWRSGTTHLYSLLAQSPDFGYVRPLATGLPWEFLSLGRLLGPVLERVLPGDRFVDRLPVRPDSPQEDETALSNMQGLSFYHGLYFPRHFRRHFRRGVFFEGCSEAEIRRWEDRFLHFHRKVALLEDAPRLLIKNPVYTARIDRLKRLFPRAKFVHIHRNPYVVFQSMRHFFRSLFRKLALQDWRDVPVEQIVLHSYPRVMRRALKDGSELPEKDYVEVRFEDLEAEPLAELRRVFDRFDLEGFEQAREGIIAYLDNMSDYQKNRYAFPRPALEAVEEHWGEFVDRWGYERPGAAAGPAPSVDSTERTTGRESP